MRNFGLLLDDIPADFQYEEDKSTFDSTVDAHIFLVNKTYKVLKDFDSSITLTVCPTQYFGDEKGYYISKFGSGIPADVSLFWTGAEIYLARPDVHQGRRERTFSNSKNFRA